MAIANSLKSSLEGKLKKIKLNSQELSPQY